jgi:hypothetical protein
VFGSVQCVELAINMVSVVVVGMHVGVGVHDGIDGLGVVVDVVGVLGTVWPWLLMLAGVGVGVSVVVVVVVVVARACLWHGRCRCRYRCRGC